jgi:putative ABC transport system ATP-binding protein
VTAPLRVEDLRKRYGSAAASTVALDGVSATFERGTFTAIMGPSGSGKSTLLQCAAGLDQPESGTVMLLGEELTGRTEDELTALRRGRVAFVFQQYNLLPVLTAVQNVALPSVLAGRRADSARIARVLDRVGLTGVARRLPAELSGGQQQRVAIARALANDAEVVFADEPTGALDTATAREVLALLRESSQESGQTVVMVTHDPVAASFADSVLVLVDGRIADTISSPTPDLVADRLAGVGRTAARAS